jgi:hypothetical protein
MPIDSTGSSFGNGVLQNLLTNTTQGNLAGAKSAASQSLEKNEAMIIDLASCGDDQALLKDFDTKYPGIAVKNKDGTFSSTATMSILEQKMNRASRTFMTSQKISDRMHEMQMEVIRQMGRV